MCTVTCTREELVSHTLGLYRNEMFPSLTPCFSSFENNENNYLEVQGFSTITLINPDYDSIEKSCYMLRF
ncbi:CLUMA_CG016723, isoform A [Clunio marinus]|uniref:CLUMA_CG016723, isoform A n=1 Tax=Clunio marinus TaxID=568069 RepID=A0A1J1IRZ5_9DIPT|nr:CLUMA_CG016723, isoform A [Clunio marinus]